jgi:hypothetical protein
LADYSPPCPWTRAFGGDPQGIQTRVKRAAETLLGLGDICRQNRSQQEKAIYFLFEYAMKIRLGCESQLASVLEANSAQAIQLGCPIRRSGRVTALSHSLNLLWDTAQS